MASIIDHCLQVAVHFGCTKIVNTLFATYCRKRKTNALCLAIESGQQEIVASLLAAGARPNDRAMQLAIATNQINIVTVLLEAGADVHSGDNAALTRAVVHGNLEAIRILLAAGANPNSRRGALLNLAIIHGNIEIVKLLLSANADYYVGDGIAIRIAIMQGHQNIAILLASYYTTERLLHVRDGLMFLDRKLRLFDDVVAQHVPRGSRTKAALRETRPDI